MNTKTRKVIAMILGLALTISLFGGVTVFAAGTVTVGLEATPATVVVGSDVTVKASITAMAAVDGIVAYSVMIKYDKDRFTYVADSDLLLQGTKSPAGDYIIGDGNLTLNNKPDVGELYVVYIDSYKGPLDGNNKPTATLPLTVGGLFSVKFTAKTGANPATDFVLSGISTTLGQNFVDNSGTDNAVMETYSPAAAAVTVQDSTPVTPVSIALTTQPTKKIYMIGKTTWGVEETLDLAGGVVTVTNSDNSTTTVLLSDCAVTGYTGTVQTTGTTTKTLTVTYGLLTTTYTVRVLRIGDVNNSGTTTPSDALQALQIYTGKLALTAENILTANANRSVHATNPITPTDSLKILQLYTGKLTAL